MTTTSFASLQAPSIGVKPAESNYRKLAQLAPEPRLAAALRILRYELDLPVEQRRRHVLARLRSWLELEHEQARRVAIAFADCCSQLEPSERQDIEQSEEDAAMDGLSFVEFHRLAEFMPAMQEWCKRLPRPRRKNGLVSSLAAALALSTPDPGF